MTLTWAEAAGDHLYIGSETGDLWRWDLAAGTSIHAAQLGGFVIRVRRVGDEIWVALRDGRLVQLDAALAPIAEHRAHDEALYGFEVHRSGERLLTGGGDGWARVWDRRGEKLYEVGSGEAKHQVRAVAFLGDDGIILGERSGFMEAYVKDGADKIAAGDVFGHGGVSAIAVSPDDRRAYFGCSRGAIRVVDVSGESWKNLDLFRSPPKPIATNAFAWSPDGRTLAAGCSDDAPLLFDTGADRGYPMTCDQVFWTRSPKPAWTKKFIVSGVCYDEAGWLYAAVMDGTVRIYGPPNDVSVMRRGVIARDGDSLRFEKARFGPSSWAELREL